MPCTRVPRYSPHSFFNTFVPCIISYVHRSRLHFMHYYEQHGAMYVFTMYRMSDFHQKKQTIFVFENFPKISPKFFLTKINRDNS